MVMDGEDWLGTFPTRDDAELFVWAKKAMSLANDVSARSAHFRELVEKMNREANSRHMLHDDEPQVVERDLGDLGA